jgi:hypothetical protein
MGRKIQRQERSGNRALQKEKVKILETDSGIGFLRDMGVIP